MKKTTAAFIAICTFTLGGFLAVAAMKSDRAQELQEIRAQLLMAENIPQPVVIEVLQLEVAGWEKGFVVDRAARDNKLAKGE